VTDDRADAQTEATLEEQVAALEAERDEHLSDLKRVAAEFENYRKRVAGGGGGGGGGGGRGGGGGGV
jgi:molecular chaperone GrpE (heat shock protein)